jgi:hypothetical protein
MSSPYQRSLEAGYSNDEIIQFLEKNPKYSEKIKKSRQSGYSNKEIGSFLAKQTDETQVSETKQTQERSLLEQSGRLAGQGALGMASIAAWPYEIAVAPLGIPGGQEAMGDLFTRDILNEVYPTEEEGRAPRETVFSQPQRELADPIDLSIRGLTEKATGLDLKPQGFLENMANWIGIIKDPKRILQAGVNPKELVKAITPTGKEILRGAGAGAAMEAANEGEFGPIGTLGLLVLGDIDGGKVSEVGQQAKQLIKAPKETLAKAAAELTSKDKIALQQDLIKDFRKAGIQADLGTITDNNLVKLLQTRLAQSGLSGKALTDLKEQTTNQIKNEYKSLADSLGEARFATNHEAGEITREAIKKARETDLSEVRGYYKEAEKSLNKTSFVNPKKISDTVDRIEKSLKPGQLKSTEQKAALEVLEKIKRDIQDSSGSLIMADVKDLMNNKIALNDIINYEVQGGTKQLLKEVVAEIDRAIISHGKENPKFARNYITANKRFSEHAKTFRNQNINNMMNTIDPAAVMNKMNTVQGIRDIQKSLKNIPEGEKIFSDLKRKKLEDVIGSNLVDSITQQVKLGTFSKLLEKGKNREIIKEILAPREFARLERLQKNAGSLAEAANKYYNSSQSGAAAIDAAILATAIQDLSHLLYGNPWPIMKTTGLVTGGRKLSGLLGNAEFLKLVEEAILNSEKGSQQELINSFEKLRPYIIEATNQSSKNTSEDPE